MAHSSQVTGSCKLHEVGHTDCGTGRFELRSVGQPSAPNREPELASVGDTASSYGTSDPRSALPSGHADPGSLGPTQKGESTCDDLELPKTEKT
jgi:hypothetical protein